ncbi:MAG: hypothetical protein ACRD1T_23865 [Acidimicrobiia bacterium]
MNEELGFDRPSHRQAPRSERGNLLFDLRETAELLTLDEDELDELWLYHPDQYISVGFMLRCQRLVRGMEALVETGLLDAAAVLVRPTIEAAVTGLWILEVGMDAVGSLLGYDRKETRRFIASLTGEKPDSGSFDRTMSFWFETAEDRPFVPIKDRAGKLYPWLQRIHFESHSWVHATVRASYLSFEMDDIEKDPERREWTGLLPRSLQGELTNAAVISLILGREVHRCLSWESAIFDELLEGLGADEDMLALFD